MSKRRYSTKAVMRVTDCMGRCEVYRATGSGLVHTEYPAHSERGSYTCQYVRNGRGETQQLFDAKGYAVISNGGDAFPAWLAGYAGASLVKDGADWERALDGVRKHAAQLKEAADEVREDWERAMWGDEYEAA